MDLKKNKINKYLSIVFVFSFVMVGVVALMPDTSSAQPEFTWHGQFRVNSYTDFRGDDSSFGKDERAAARLRWRPTIDVKMSESVSLHTQFNIGHINSNTYNACGGGNDCFMLRHAVIQVDLFDTGITGMAGLVPISDKFGDTMFSGDWDFNPLALVFVSKTNDFSWRGGLGKLQEGPSEGGLGAAGAQTDDLDIYIFDADHSSGLGASVYWLHGGDDRGNASGAKRSMAGGGMQELDLVIYGGRWSGEFNQFKVNAFVAGSNLNADNYWGGTANLESNGFAGKLEVKFPVQDMTVGIMGLVSSGDKNFGVAGTGTASSFITPMSIAGTTGYWGYTGRLNEQGPTDTGIDDHTVNLDGGGLPWSSYGNLGYGLWTIQGNVSVPVNDILSAYFGIGYYESMDTPAGQSDKIGLDIYAQGKLNLGQNLNLEFGVDHLAAGKGHYNNVAGAVTNGGVATNSSGVAQSRGITTVFSRLQLEY